MIKWGVGIAVALGVLVGIILLIKHLESEKKSGSGDCSAPSKATTVAACALGKGVSAAGQAFKQAPNKDVDLSPAGCMAACAGKPGLNAWSFAPQSGSGSTAKAAQCLCYAGMPKGQLVSLKGSYSAYISRS